VTPFDWPTSLVPAGNKLIFDSSQYALSGGAYNVGRNLLHNPLFAVAQRGTGTFTAQVGWAYTYDRWHVTVMAAGDAYSVSRNATTDADRTAIGDEGVPWVVTHNVAGAAGTTNGCVFGQPIESVRRLSGKTVTVSFWAQIAAGTKVGVALTQDFGSGGSPSAPVVGTGQSVTGTTGAWIRYSLTFALPSAAGKTFEYTLEGDPRDPTTGAWTGASRTGPLPGACVPAGRMIAL
jgi:hypothetical protein